MTQIITVLKPIVQVLIVEWLELLNCTDKFVNSEHKYNKGKKRFESVIRFNLEHKTLRFVNKICSQISL